MQAASILLMLSTISSPEIEELKLQFDQCPQLDAGEPGELFFLAPPKGLPKADKFPGGGMNLRPAMARAVSCIITHYYMLPDQVQIRFDSIREMTEAEIQDAANLGRHEGRVEAISLGAYSRWHVVLIGVGLTSLGLGIGIVGERWLW